MTWRVLINKIATRVNLEDRWIMMLSNQCIMYGSIWMTVVGKIWKHRNKSIFRNNRIDHVEVFTVMQLKVWSWITSMVVVASFSYSDWCVDPLVCMKSIRKAWNLTLDGSGGWLVWPIYGFEQSDVLSRWYDSGRESLVALWVSSEKPFPDYS